MYNIRQGQYEGEKSKVNKLSQKDVIKIRSLLKEGVKQKELAAKFCVNQSTISKIKSRQSWQAVTLFTDTEREIELNNNYLDDMEYLSMYYGECL